MDESFLGAARAAVEPYRHLIAGDLLAGFLCCKGVPGPAEQAGGAICSGEDGIALAKGMERVRLPPSMSQDFPLVTSASSSRPSIRRWW